MFWTEEQKEIIKSKERLLVINACAGSGKTSTLLGIMKSNKNSRILYLVFNSSMKKESEEKIKKYKFYNTQVKTGHGLAYKYFGRMNELGNISYLDIANYFQWGSSASKRGYLRILYSYYKLYLQSSEKNLEEFLELDLENLLLKLKVYIKNINKKILIEHMEKIWLGMENGQIKMSHDFYLKYYQLSNIVENNFDIVLLDEAQDTNDIMINIMENKFPNARKIIVGDHNQSIYAWRGAVNAMEYFESLAYAKSLNLTNSFRIGNDTANTANDIINIKSDRKFQIKGLNYKQKISLNIDEKKQFTYLARTNSALFEYAVNNMDKKFFFNSKVSFEILYEVYFLYIKEKNKIKNLVLKEYYDFESLKFHVEQEALEDVEIRIAVKVVDKYKEDTLKHLKILERNTTKNTEANVILSTVHASKGLEYEKIILADDYINILKVKDKIENLKNKIREEKLLGESIVLYKLINKLKELEAWFVEECNILYVAVTRSFGEIKLNKSLLTLQEKPFTY